MTDDLASTKGRKSGSRLRRLRHGWLALPSTLFVSVALLVAACGGPSSGPGVASVSSSSTSSTEATGSQTTDTSSSSSALAYASCMRNHGITDFPDSKDQLSPQPGPGSDLNPENPRYQAAEQACKSLLPQSGTMPPAQQAQMQAQALRYSECMRDHGIKDFPDLTVTPDGGVSVGIPLSSAAGDLDPNNPQFQAAQNACQSLMPQKGGGTGTSTIGAADHE